jgi:hypothetical protein
VKGPGRQRPVVAALGLLVLAACGSAQQAPPPTSSATGISTLRIVADEAAGGTMWDGVVQSQEQATLSAQTGGRGSLRPMRARQAIRKAAFRPDSCILPAPATCRAERHHSRGR